MKIVLITLAAIFVVAKAGVCPGGQSECPTGTTCCSLSSGQFGCCPFPNATCCSDHEHCCPGGYTCNVASGSCQVGNKVISMRKKIPATPAPSSNGVCPDGQSECPAGTTCCISTTGAYACCPFPNATCCSDKKHCCPNGYTCNVAAGTCQMGTFKLPMYAKFGAKKSNNKVKVSQPASNGVCADGISECPAGTTCCKLASGAYGCCPYPNATCCSDMKHCCPSGFTCQVASGTCQMGTVKLPMFAKVSAKKVKTDPPASNGVCPDGISECPAGTTCCKLVSGSYGCCPYTNAVCCSDHEHCCPSGYTCNVGAGTCRMGVYEVPMFAKFSVKKVKEPASNGVCPGGQSECPTGTTCCKLSSGSYGCCPFPNATCCADMQHCCPSGFKCNTSAGTCMLGKIELPMFARISANKVTKSSKSEKDFLTMFVV